MKIDAVGETGVVMTDANEPVLSGGDQVIGFRELEYEIYGGGLVKKALVSGRKGWVWQTRKRVLLLDQTWMDLPGGKRGKRFHEVLNEEAVRVVHKRKRVLLLAASPDRGRVTFEFRPFGAASRLLAWLKNEKEHREMREEGTLRSPYKEEMRRT
ncbi:MAG: hypothetical protein A3K59_03110 [Euryarchaeota archaeon RBG_19FT_COMBO_69_17]|nr:MAG: hypothetical protein A3K59_03110 [Euryarchaeota archaeon RBG_19FT_COMBO_69_17]